MWNTIRFLACCSLLACAPKFITQCPVEIPDVWRKPPYERLTTGGWGCGENDEVCFTFVDYQKVVKNQAQCDQVRRGLIDLYDEINAMK